MVMNENEKHYLGQGWRYSPGVDAKGGIALAGGAKDIESSILVILGTAKGERVMRPEFGSSIHDYVFAPNNSTTHGLMAYYVKDALAQWEPRITVTEVDVRADNLNLHRALIDIQYTIKSMNDKRNLVYPFYLIPREE